MPDDMKTIIICAAVGLIAWCWALKRIDSEEPVELKRYLKAHGPDIENHQKRYRAYRQKISDTYPNLVWCYEDTYLAWNREGFVFFSVIPETDFASCKSAAKCEKILKNTDFDRCEADLAALTPFEDVVYFQAEDHGRGASQASAGGEGQVVLRLKSSEKWFDGRAYAVFMRLFPEKEYGRAQEKIDPCLGQKAES